MGYICERGKDTSTPQQYHIKMVLTIAQRNNLADAARQGDEVAVRSLLNDSITPNTTHAGHGRTPLSWAAEMGHEGVIKLLLEFNADVDKADERDGGRTPLSWATEMGHEGVIRLLLESNADINKADEHDGRTPLFLAIEAKNWSIIDLLHHKNAAVNIANSQGQTPLLYALMAG